MKKQSTARWILSMIEILAVALIVSWLLNRFTGAKADISEYDDFRWTEDPRVDVMIDDYYGTIFGIEERYIFDDLYLLVIEYDADLSGGTCTEYALQNDGMIKLYSGSKLPLGELGEEADRLGAQTIEWIDEIEKTRRNRG